MGGRLPTLMRAVGIARANDDPFHAPRRKENMRFLVLGPEALALDRLTIVARTTTTKGGVAAIVEVSSEDELPPECERVAINESTGFPVSFGRLGGELSTWEKLVARS